MVALSNHPIRALSPITELTTPTSLRTLQLPFEESDYHSERRISTPTPNQNHDDDDDVSVYSQLSAETVKNDTQPQPQNQNQKRNEEPPQTPTNRQRTISLPTPPPRSPRRIISNERWKPLNIESNHSFLRNNLVPFPQSRSPVPSPTPTPGGLPPPPRTQMNNKQKLIRRVTPPTTPTLHSTNQLGLSKEGYDRGSDQISETSAFTGNANMAGIGAGRSLAQENRVRSTSLYASPVEGGSGTDIPTNDPPSSSLDLLNIPVLASVTVTNETVSPPRSKPNSLKKRPKSYHGSRPNSIRSRPNSFHEGSTTSHSTTKLVTPALGLDPLTTPMQVQAEVIIGNSNFQSFSQDDLRPTLVLHQSESSLPSRAKSNRSTSPTKKSPRRRRVSSIFSSIFGVDQDKDHVSRNLSKTSRKTSGSGLTSRGSSRASSPMSRSGILSESPAQEDIIGPIQSAIRTSGTFGIRDDGSEISAGGTPGNISHNRHTFDRSGSGNGSIMTQSEGVKRVLYVENLVSTPETELELEGVKNVRQASENSASGSGSGTGSGISEHRTPPHSKVTPVALVGLLPSNGQTHSHNIPHLSQSESESNFYQDHDSSAGLTPITNVTNSSTSTSSSNDSHGINVAFDPTRLNATPTSTDVQHSSSTHLPLSGTSENMVDESVQTSTQPSPAKSTRARPLPRPPSASVTPVATPKPTFIHPLPPSTSPSTGLPLLIASHLLSTHAAALLRHSTSMQEVSETMHKMAKESLDWGGVLMGMANRSEVRVGEGLPRIPEYQLGREYEGIPLPRPATFAPKPDLPRSSTATYNPPQNVYTDLHDPVQQAYDALNGQNLTRPPPRTGVTSQIPQPEIRRRKGESLPADLLKEAQRLGNEGWTNLHKAEEAWSEAMSGLAELIKFQALVDQHEGGPSVVQAENPSSQGGIASTKPNLNIDPLLYSPSSQINNPLLLPYTSLSYPLGSSNSIHRHTSMSFLPDDRDMRFPLTPTASASSHSHLSFPHPHIPVHPFQNLSGSLPSKEGVGHGLDPGSQNTIKLRPQSIQPSSSPKQDGLYRPNIPFPTRNQGYTSEHLGFNSNTTPGKTTSSNGEDRMTPSRSTMTSSSHSPNVPKFGRQNGSTKGTGGRKLAKKQNTLRTPTLSGSDSGIFGRGDMDNESNSRNGSTLKGKSAEGGGGGGGKKHWWNKKRLDRVDHMEDVL